MRTFILEPGRIPAPMRLYGVDDRLYRLPAEVAKNVSNAVYEMCGQTAGGRLKFRTDSRYLGIKAELESTNINTGIDVVADGFYCGKVRGNNEEEEYQYEGMLSLGQNDSFMGITREVTVFLPRVARPKRVIITLDDEATVAPPTPYKIEKPIVWYGSSITHGGSSNSPSLCHAARVSEMLGANHVNLGFGGSAMAEVAMAEYIASLDMTAFIFDYEHNASSIEYLKNTHKRFFDIVRKAQPDLPIMMISRPDTDREFLRSCRGRQVIMDTFHQALDDGDKNVEYIDGFYLWGDDDRQSCTVDGCHPSEKGFGRMADTIYPRLQAFLKKCGIDC